MSKKKIIRISTAPESLLILLPGQLNYLSNYFEVIGIASPGPELEEVRAREKIKVIPVKMYRRISIIRDIHSIITMYRIFRKEKPFIVHSITPKAGFVSMIAGYLAGVPNRIHTFTGLIFPTRKGILRFILMNIDRLICFLATIVIPEGQGVRNDLLKHKITGKELNIIANGNVNGIDPEYFNCDYFTEEDNENLKRKLGIKLDMTVITFMGRIVREKGIEELVDAFICLYDEIQDLKLLIIGRTEEKLDPISEKSRMLIEKHSGIISVPFQSDVRPYLAISDLFVLPSYREGFPNTLLQAGAMGIPCVATNINGSNEIIIHNKNGILVSPRDFNELKTAIGKLVVDVALREEMAAHSRRLIENRYDRRFVWEGILQLYTSLT